MSVDIWAAYVVTCVVLLIIPGPTMLAVMSFGIAHGHRARVPLVAGVALGDATALAVSLIGLGALLAASAMWFTVVKVVGALYLLFLGVSLLRAGASRAALPAVAPAPGWWRLFAHTYVVTALNPKSIVFFIAFLPQFVNSAQPAGPQLWTLAATFVALATLAASGYAAFAAVARRALASPRAQRGVNLLGGSLLAAAGLWALAVRRQA